jgi:hypothetical protein
LGSFGAAGPELASVGAIEGHHSLQMCTRASDCGFGFGRRGWTGPEIGFVRRIRGAVLDARPGPRLGSFGAIGRGLASVGAAD